MTQMRWNRHRPSFHRPSKPSQAEREADRILAQDAARRAAQPAPKPQPQHQPYRPSGTDAASSYRSRIPPRGDTLRCRICSVATDEVVITSAIRTGSLTTFAFCSRAHAAEGGFPWAGQR